MLNARSGNVQAQLSEHPLAAWYAELPVILTHTHMLPQTGEGHEAEDWAGAARNAVARLDRLACTRVRRGDGPNALLLGNRQGEFAATLHSGRPLP